MLFPVKFTVYIVYVQLGPNKLLNKSMVCSHFVPMVVLYSIILYSSWVQNDSTNWAWLDCGCETIGNQIYTVLLPSLQLTPHVTFFFIPAFRCFKENSYFVGTCKRKIKVKQVKSPKKTLFVCLFFHWIFSFSNIFTSTPTLDILLKLVFRYIRLETLIAFLNIFF